MYFAIVNIKGNLMVENVEHMVFCFQQNKFFKTISVNIPEFRQYILLGFLRVSKIVTFFVDNWQLFLD